MSNIFYFIFLTHLEWINQKKNNLCTQFSWCCWCREQLIDGLFIFFFTEISMKQQNTHGQLLQVQRISVKVGIRSRKWNRFILEMLNGDVLLFAFDIKIDMWDNWIRQYLICKAINKYKRNCNFTSGRRHINFVCCLLLTF